MFIKISRYLFLLGLVTPSITSLKCYSCGILYFHNNTRVIVADMDIEQQLEDCPITVFQTEDSCVRGVLIGAEQMPVGAEDAFKMEFYRGLTPDDLIDACQYVGFTDPGDGSATCDVAHTCTSDTCNTIPVFSCDSCKLKLGEYCNPDTRCDSVLCSPGVSECWVVHNGPVPGCPTSMVPKCADIGGTCDEDCDKCSTSGCKPDSTEVCSKDRRERCAMKCHSCDVDLNKYCSKYGEMSPEFDIDTVCPPVKCEDGVSKCYSEFSGFCKYSFGCFGPDKTTCDGKNCELCADEKNCNSKAPEHEQSLDLKCKSLTLCNISGSNCIAPEFSCFYLLCLIVIRHIYLID